MKLPGFLIALAATAAVPLAAPFATPRVTPNAVPLGPAMTELEEIRMKVWVDWFSGDTAALRRVLAPELVAIGPDSPHWQSLDETLAASLWFKESGGRLLEITFDSTEVQRYGDVAVMFSHYAMRISRSGAVSTRKGKVTEVFVRRRGRWVHTSWHIDAAAVSSTGE
jgi:ketosteroid isomerase-like protein